VFTGKVGCSFVGETNSTKLLAPAHLGFVPMGFVKLTLGIFLKKSAKKGIGELEPLWRVPR